MDTSANYSHTMAADAQYHHQQQQAQPWSQQGPHLLHPAHQQSGFPSPSSPTTQLSDQHYPPFSYSQPQPDDRAVDRSHTALSLNLSSLSVTSPTNLSPINPSPHPSTHPSSHVSPITPISPAGGVIHAHQQLSSHHSSHLQPFQFVPDNDGTYDYSATRRLTSSRSSSSSDRSVPRKRSFTTGTPLTTSVEESYEQTGYEDVDMSYGLDPEGSPIEGSTSGGEQEDQLKPLASSSTSTPASMNLLGKPLGTNNFVTKLYQMINDPKSAQFIIWTELGTSFVVSNVGEFSRTILGSHFKHNNFSSFVRQLNMYGFHKINRTPRAQRTSADVQTWEFSHHKFLRGRPDLLEEIKRKALEPDPSLKHRVELPGEVAAQLAQVREDNRRLTIAVNTERAKVTRLAHVTKVMYDTLSKAFPGNVPIPFPTDLLESKESLNIYVTSPMESLQSSSGFPPPAPPHMNTSLHAMHGLSPSSSPTTTDFPSHTSTPHTLSRQHSFQHMPYDAVHGNPGLTHISSVRYEAALSTPLPPSPGTAVAADPFDERGGKRQRTGAPPGQMSGATATGEKRVSRARSDSAPLGYGFGSAWPQTRPRSGSGLGSRLRRDEGPIPNVAAMSRGNAVPTLSIPSPGKQSPGS